MLEEEVVAPDNVNKEPAKLIVMLPKVPLGRKRKFTVSAEDELAMQKAITADMEGEGGGKKKKKRKRGEEEGYDAEGSESESEKDTSQSKKKLKIKNRVAAREFRFRQKIWIKDLEQKQGEGLELKTKLEKQIKAAETENKEVKNALCHCRDILNIFIPQLSFAANSNGVNLAMLLQSVENSVGCSAISTTAITTTSSAASAVCSKNSAHSVQEPHPTRVIEAAGCLISLSESVPPRDFSKTPNGY